MMMDIHVNEKKSTVAKPAQDTPKSSLWLSNLDLLARRSHIWALYVYRFDGSSNFFDFQVLKDALSKALVTFYPLAGRLIKTGDDEGGRIEVDCNGAGAVLVEAATSSALDDLGDFTPSLQLMKLFPTVHHYTLDISSCPILLAQVTHFKCGGVSIGIGIHHTVVDGTSSIDFINYWSSLARGLHQIPIPPPFMDRRRLQARNPPTPLFDHVEYQLPPSLQTPPTDTSQAADPLVSKLMISPNRLNLLMSKFKDEINEVRYSTFEIVASHVWRCLCKARNLPQDEVTTIYVPTSGRARLRPPLPPAFFGSAVFIAAAVATVGDLLSSSGTLASARIHDALARMDDEYLRSALDYLELQPDLTLMFRRSETCRFSNLGFVSWAKLPLYDADFGWGRPIYVGPPKVLYEGQAYLLPSPPDDHQARLYLLISLQKQQMESFLHYFYSDL
ncbi:hypothetical protein ACLOJK_041617 [Asimina triloba]